MTAFDDAWGDASRTVRRHVVTPGGVVTMPIDVSRVLNKLEQIEQDIEQTSAFLAEADTRATGLKVKYELDYARAVILATGSNKEVREAKALLEVENVYRDWMMQDRVVRSTREALFALRDRMKTLQSISAMIRDAVSTTG